MCTSSTPRGTTSLGLSPVSLQGTVPAPFHTSCDLWVVVHHDPPKSLRALTLSVVDRHGHRGDSRTPGPLSLVEVPVVKLFDPINDGPHPPPRRNPFEGPPVLLDTSLFRLDDGRGGGRGDENRIPLHPPLCISTRVLGSSGDVVCVSKVVEPEYVLIFRQGGSDGTRWSPVVFCTPDIPYVLSPPRPLGPGFQPRPSTGDRCTSSELASPEQTIP